ncbi:TPA: efflux RND transporter periplasmic adaptor subunit [Escherichia coli]|nr:efflux RND transporter periplasmic adaptor subunit [Escherichia coli]
MKKIALIIGSMIAGGIISAAGFTWFDRAEPPAEKTSTAERKILFWYDPMYPNTRFDKPGKSPFMDMDLVPKYADEESSASGVRIDPTQTQNLGVKTATVTRGPLTFAQSFPANVSYNEYQYAIVQARAAGFIDKVYPLTVPARPDKTLTIRKWTLLPGVDAATRTLQLRLEVDNADEALKPGMNAWLQLNTASEPMLLIPSQALIDTGNEQRVITVDADGRFVPKRVAVFQASQGVTALRSGLAEGEKVVSSGLFLIDSEANISGALERMRSESATHAH